MKERTHIVGALALVLIAWCFLVVAGTCTRPARPPVEETAEETPEVSAPIKPPVPPEQLPGETASPTKTDPYPYCGARDSKVFHRCDADHVHLIKPENLVRWKSREEAVAAGRHPCKLCNP